MQDRIEKYALELLHAISEHHPDIYAGAWVNPYTSAPEAGLARILLLRGSYGVSAGRGRIGAGGGNQRARGSYALHYHAPGHGDAAKGVTWAKTCS